MYREPDLIDVWFDSGAMPYAQWHYPFENQAVFAKNFPADFIAEGVDQTRGWFFTLHALAVMLEDSVAFKNVIANGLVLDKNGNKMSKRLGNAVDPFATIAQFGPDATRWYMIANSPPWDNLKFDQAGVTEVQRKFFGTLFNTYSFFALYANLDGYQTREFDRVPLADLSELDRWILSKLHTLIGEVRGHLDSYDPTKAARAIQEFVTDQLSNWYVRLSRRRFWKGELTTDKRAAYETLQQCLVVVSQLMSPIAPFFGDWLYKNMTDGMRAEAVVKNTPLAPESVHLTLFAEADTALIDKALEERMELAQRISSLTHSLRKKSVLKVRQPLQRILVPVLNDTTKEQVGKVEDLICAEVNVKHVEFLDDTSGVLVKSVKPNFKRPGPARLAGGYRRPAHRSPRRDPDRRAAPGRPSPRAGQPPPKPAQRLGPRSAGPHQCAPRVQRARRAASCRSLVWRLYPRGSAGPASRLCARSSRRRGAGV
jgi:isoleucyl-tRNA synthetase